MKFLQIYKFQKFFMKLNIKKYLLYQKDFRLFVNFFKYSKLEKKFFCLNKNSANEKRNFTLYFGKQAPIGHFN